ncbi:MAG: hypothetical protein JEY97_15160 [Bacteroidales bacterium]|nr:hypothetical protein [Bacteroidales bacterium]
MRLFTFKTIVYIFLFILILFSCNNNPQNEFSVIKKSINNQGFELITAYRLFDDYIKTSKNESTNLYKKLIFNPLKKEFSENAEYPFILSNIENPIIPNNELLKEIEILKNSDLIKIAKNALKKISLALPGPSTKILFIPANPEYRNYYEKYNIGVTAVTVGSGKIIVSIDPTFKNWKELLPYVLAHEYHHSVWTSRNFETINFSLLEFLIFEGRADSFASSVYPDKNITWTSIINKETENRVWEIIKTDLDMRGHTICDKVMMGTNEIPFASGYTIGFNIVQSFKENNPEFSDIEIIDFTPNKILNMSEYE